MTDEVRIYTQQGNIHFARLRIPQVFIYITLIGARSQHLPLDKVIIYINSVPSTTKKHLFAWVVVLADDQCHDQSVQRQGLRENEHDQHADEQLVLVSGTSAPVVLGIETATTAA